LISVTLVKMAGGERNGSTKTKTRNWGQAQITLNALKKFKYHITKNQQKKKNRDLLKKVLEIQRQFSQAIKDEGADLEGAFARANHKIKQCVELHAMAGKCVDCWRVLIKHLEDRRVQ